MPTINPIQSALATAQSQATQALNQSGAPKTNNNTTKTTTAATPKDEVTISAAARQAQTQPPAQSQLQAQQAKPAIASGNDANESGEGGHY